MYIIYTKKEIIKRLNKYFSNLEDIKILCNIINNKVDLFYEIVDKMITFSYNNPHKFMKETRNILDAYYYILDEYIFRYKVDNKFIEKLDIPNRENITKICQDNIKEKEEEDRKEQERNDYYLGLMEFSEIGMVYTRPEMVKLNVDFKYYYATSTNNVYFDYTELFNDDRYENYDENNPLNRDYEENLELIKRDNDIRLSKLNNLYKIENGRHRLLYLLMHERNEEIPCIVTRRIENKDFNVFTYYLRKKYKVYIYKNNLLNDELDIILIYNNKLYQVTNMKQLADFTKNIEDESIISKYYISDFKINDEYTNMDRLKEYVKELVSIYNEEGYEFLDQNFTDVLKRFKTKNNEDFYKAFYILKYYYLKNKVYEKQEKIYDYDLDVHKKR